LRKKAAEELKKEQERKAQERRRIIEERCGQPKNLENANEGEVSFLLPAHFFFIFLFLNRLYTCVYFHEQAAIYISEKFFIGNFLSNFGCHNISPSSMFLLVCHTVHGYCFIGLFKNNKVY
jgi:hypothetical protein